MNDSRLVKRIVLFLTSIVLFAHTTGYVYAAESFKLTPEKAEKNHEGAIKFHYTLDAGETLEDVLHVSRKRSHLQPATLDINYFVVDGQMSQNGFISMQSEFADQNNVGKWIELEKSQDTIERDAYIPFTITVPDNATPGQHIGGFIVTEREPEDEGGGGSGGASTRIRLRYATSVQIDVKGEIDRSFEINNVEYVIEDGTLYLRFEFANTGNVIHQFDGNFVLTGFYSDAVIEVPQKRILPGEVVHVEESFDDLTKLIGGFDVELLLQNQVNFEDSAKTEIFQHVQRVNYIPMMLIGVLIFTFLIVYGIIYRFLKRSNFNTKCTHKPKKKR